MKYQRIILAIISFMLTGFSVQAGDMTSEAGKETLEAFLMPTFHSDADIKVSRAVQIDEESADITRNLTIYSESTKFSVFFKKGTIITDKEDNVLTPLIKIPRKTLFSVANIPSFDGTLMYQFLIAFGNHCHEASKDIVENNPDKSVLNIDDFLHKDQGGNEANICSTPAEKYSVNAVVTIPIPEALLEEEFDLLFFSMIEEQWYQQEYERDDIANLLIMQYPTAGFTAFVKKGAKAKTLDKKDEEVVETNDSQDSQQENSTQKEERTISINEKRALLEAKRGVKSVSKVKEPAVLFKDLTASHWVIDTLEFMIERGIFASNLEKNFNPERSVNRAEIAKMLVDAFDLPLAEEIEFLNFSRTSWFAPYVQTMVDLGIMSPYQKHQFFPNKTISRAEALVIIVRAARFQIDRAYKYFEFSDVNSDAWFAPELAFACDYGLINKGEQFNPNRKVTRAEFAKMLEKAIVYSAEAKNLNEDFGRRLPEKFAFSAEDLAHFETNLAPSDYSKDIERLKNILQYLGYFHGVINENFDGDLQNALIEFQLHEGIIYQRDGLGAGFLGRLTRNRLNEIMDTLEW